MHDILDAVGLGDALIVVPPFASLDRASLAAHLLQACARQAGFEVRVLYANVLLAAAIGEEAYHRICYAPTLALVGERIFAAAAYGVPPLGGQPERMLSLELLMGVPEGVAVHAGPPVQFDIPLPQLFEIERKAGELIERVAAALARSSFRVIGSTTTFEQTAASIAMLSRIKRARPNIVTVLGGANCDGALADGVASISPDIDYIFSGESETAWPRFLHAVSTGAQLGERIIRGEPCEAMDALPPPVYEEFYGQFRRWLPESDHLGEVWLPYETSRGCWWGQKHHCTFCGLNANGMHFRQKAPSRVLDDLKQLMPAHPNRRVYMVDNIMPFQYFVSVLPRLERELPGLELFYEEKANLSLEKVLVLRRAGAVRIQPGIEALSTTVLKRMNKGVTAPQNIALLRYARATGLALSWNILWGFPGDRLEEYSEVLHLMPLLRHLPPPSGLYHLSIDRFSPYFDRPLDYGVRNLRPAGSYVAILPGHVAPETVAYHFIGDYPCDLHDNPEIMGLLSREITAWQGAWEGGQDLPSLIVTCVLGRYILLDTRGLPGMPEMEVIDREQALAVLVAHPLSEPAAQTPWALQRRCAVRLDSSYVPLATADPQVLLEFERWQHGSARHGAPLLRARL